MADIIYFSHGGGPMPFMGEPSHRAMVSFLENLPGEVEKPSAIIVVSAHWEESIPSVIGYENPPLLYDYYGFPDETYNIKYPVKGDGELAKRLSDIFNSNGLEFKEENNRGFDHGLFIPMKLMYPEADIRWFSSPL